MKLSDLTVSMLKNFSDINSSICISKGSSLNTISTTKSILANVEVDDKFPVDFAIYDLHQFLNVVSLFGNPTFEFNKDSVVITDNGMNITYRYGDPTAITVPPEDYQDKMATAIDPVAIEFKLSQENVRSIRKTSSVIEAPDIEISSVDGKVVDIIVMDRNDPSSNVARVQVDAEKKGKAFSAHTNIDSLKLYDGNYNIKIGGKDRPAIIQFFEIDSGVVYWVATDATSKY